MTRAREFAVHAAVGASRLQLLRPLITEALLLALAGGTLAILFAYWFRDWVAVRSTGENSERVDFVVDWAVMTWAFVAALAFGLAPALFTLRLDLHQTLKSGGRGTTGDRGHQRFRQMLVVGQIALPRVLLAGAGLYIRGLDALNKRRTGWGWPEIRKFVVEGQDRPVAGREPGAVVNCVSHHYFDTYGTRVLSGRSFHERDTRRLSVARLLVTRPPRQEDRCDVSTARRMKPFAP